MFMSTSEFRIRDNCIAEAVADAIIAAYAEAAVMYGTITNMREFGDGSALCDITHKPNTFEILTFVLCQGIQKHIIFSSRYVSHV